MLVSEYILFRKTEDLMEQLFAERMGEGSRVNAPAFGIKLENIIIRSHIMIKSSFLAMARGELVIKADVQILINNHDYYRWKILLCKPGVLRKGAWNCVGQTSCRVSLSESTPL